VGGEEVKRSGKGLKAAEKRWDRLLRRSAGATRIRRSASQKGRDGFEEEGWSKKKKKTGGSKQGYRMVLGGRRAANCKPVSRLSLKKRPNSSSSPKQHEEKRKRGGVIQGSNHHERIEAKKSGCNIGRRTSVRGFPRKKSVSAIAR